MGGDVKFRVVALSVRLAGGDEIVTVTGTVIGEGTPAIVTATVAG